MLKLISVAALVAVPSFAMAADLSTLKEMIRQEVAVDCKVPASLALPDEMFVPKAGGKVEVHLGYAECGWTFMTNPWCGAAKCTVRTYAPQGAGWTEIGARLE
ncbi:MAG: hypothetical protein AB7U46_15450 [Paenirhodobacter sp.]|uniref:hypothetical protein n=1 Tax=Paenirhodobacter sp. TaxID=1965326 RepID=UPI003D117A30